MNQEMSQQDLLVRLRIAQLQLSLMENERRYSRLLQEIQYLTGRLQGQQNSCPAGDLHRLYHQLQVGPPLHGGGGVAALAVGAGWTYPDIPWPVFTPPPEIPLPPLAVDTAKIFTYTRRQLAECSWYYPQLDSAGAARLLQLAGEGTFLVRDSCNPKFLFSLSVQRGPGLGPTSVRIVFSEGKFQLEADDSAGHRVARHDSVGELVSHYMTSSGADSVFVDQTDKVYCSLRLRRPLRRSLPSLAHLCRLSINRSLEAAATDAPSEAPIFDEKEQQRRRKRLEGLQLPNKLVDYVNSYQLNF